MSTCFPEQLPHCVRATTSLIITRFWSDEKLFFQAVQILCEFFQSTGKLPWLKHKKIKKSTPKGASLYNEISELVGSQCDSYG